MEKIPFSRTNHGRTRLRPIISSPRATGRPALPVLAGSNFTLRELRVEDAASLLAMLTTEEVSRFISPPPTTVEGFEKFIEWAQRERAAGNYACFAVVPARASTPPSASSRCARSNRGFAMAEWGFALGSPFWGTNLFAEGRAPGARLHLRDARRRAASRRAPRSATRAATARCERSAPCRRACCGARSSVTACTTTRCCGRFSQRTGPTGCREANRAQ